MEPAELDPTGDFGEPDRLDTTTTDPRPPARVRTVVLGAAIAVTGVLVAVTALSGVGISSSAPSSEQSSAPTPSATRSIAWPTPRQPSLRPAPLAVFSSSGFLADLDVVVYARSDRALFRIDTRRGRVTRTPVEPPPDPAALLALTDRVIERPWDDDADGLQIVDGRWPEPLPGRLAEGGQALPGPPGRIWLVSDTVVSGRVTALLLDAGGRRVHERHVLPENGEITPDGAGGLFWSGIGGTYRSGTSGLRRASTGRVLGANATGFVATECNTRFVCASYAYDHAGGNRRRVGPAVADGYATGALSPDGRRVTVQRWRDPDGPTVSVHDLATGRELASFDVPPSDGDNDPSPTWLPDGRLLVLQDSRLTVYDPRTKKNERISLRLPPLRQLAVRVGG